MSNLVFLNGSQVVTSTIIIAGETGNEHASVIKLVREYLPDFEEFGQVDFKSTRPDRGGHPIEEALLNQEHATLLITYMRNNDIVRAFKKRLVKAFYEFARQAPAFKLEPRNPDPRNHRAHTLEGPHVQALKLTPLAMRAAKAFGFKGNQATLSANTVVRHITGFNLLEAMGQPALATPDNEPLLTSTDLALRLGIGKREVNPLLIDCGFQTGHRDHKNRLYYELTDEGQKYGVILDTDKKHGGAPIRQIKWSAKVLPILEVRLQVESEHQEDAA